MKIGKKVAIILLVVFLGIQFVPTKRNQSDNISASDIMIVYKVPEQIENKIKVSCYDCHSNNTQYPWYNKIQPVAWFLEGHIKKAKEELNFSEFGDYSKRRQKNKLKSIINQIRDNEMPLSSYTFMHKDAVLSESEKSELENWISNLRDSL
ncbi:MAG: heme-binding domain-containing protein [Bacteroidetes bacterium]|nr:heme-binding domain-containing protein [Bacteroidota bacterium]